MKIKVITDGHQLFQSHVSTEQIMALVLHVYTPEKEFSPELIAEIKSYIEAKLNEDV